AACSNLQSAPADAGTGMGGSSAGGQGGSSGSGGSSGAGGAPGVGGSGGAGGGPPRPPCSHDTTCPPPHCCHSVLLQTACGSLQKCDATGTCIDRFAEFAVPGANPRPGGITVGPDNELWFVASNTSKVHRISTNGTVNGDFTVSGAPTEITMGPDHNI